MPTPDTEVDLAFLDIDAGHWERAQESLRSGQAAARRASDALTVGAPFEGVARAYHEQANAVAGNLETGHARLQDVRDLLARNKARYLAADSHAKKAVASAGHRAGGSHPHPTSSMTPGHGHGGVPDPGPVADPRPGPVPAEPTPHTPWRDLEAQVDKALEHDRQYGDATTPAGPFETAQRSVIAYTAADGSTHLVSTMPGQGDQARELTVSFLDRDGKAEVVTFSATSTPGTGGAGDGAAPVDDGVMRALGGASQVNIRYVDSAGQVHTLSTGSGLGNVVVGYVDSQGRQHMVSNEPMPSASQPGSASGSVAR